MRTKLLLLSVLMCISFSVRGGEFRATNNEGIVFLCESLPDGECSINWLVDELETPTAINIPETLYDGEVYRTVTKIGLQAFENKHNLTAVTLPHTIRVISNSAFSNCELLSEIEIPDGVNSIDRYAFANCGLKEVLIPESVSFIGRHAFECSSFEKVEFASLETLFKLDFIYKEQNPLYDAHHLYYKGVEVTDLTIPESISRLNSFALCNLINLKSLHVPATLKQVGMEAVYDCENLKEVYFDNMESLCGIKYDEYHQLFDNAEHLYVGGKECNALVVDEGIEAIGDYALADFKGLTSVKFGESLTSIGTGAFYGCSNLSSITLPESINWIGDEAFEGCKLRAIQILAPVPPSIGSTSFSGQSTYHTTLYVPQDHFDDYAYDDTYWYRFINIKEFVGESASLNSNTVYTLKDRDAGSFLVYDAVNDCLGSINVDTNIDSNALAHNWQVVRQGNDASLYNLEAKRYLCQQPDGTWGLTSEAQPLSLTDGSFGSIALDGEGEWMFVVNNSLSPSRPEGIETLCEDATISPQQLYDLYGRKATAHSTILIGRDSNGTRKVMVR